MEIYPLGPEQWVDGMVNRGVRTKPPRADFERKRERMERREVVIETPQVVAQFAAVATPAPRVFEWTHGFSATHGSGHATILSYCLPRGCRDFEGRGGGGDDGALAYCRRSTVKRRKASSACGKSSV